MADGSSFFSVAAVPEPASVAMTLMGLVGTVGLALAVAGPPPPEFEPPCSSG